MAVLLLLMMIGCVCYQVHARVEFCSGLPPGRTTSVLLAGEEVIFHCNVPREMTSSESVSWFITRPNQQEEKLSNLSPVSSTHTVSNVSRDSEGIYSCRIFNNTLQHVGCIVVRAKAVMKCAGATNCHQDSIKTANEPCNRNIVATVGENVTLDASIAFVDGGATNEMQRVAEIYLRNQTRDQELWCNATTWTCSYSQIDHVTVHRQLTPDGMNVSLVLLNVSLSRGGNYTVTMEAQNRHDIRDQHCLEYSVTVVEPATSTTPTSTTETTTTTVTSVTSRDTTADTTTGTTADTMTDTTTNTEDVDHTVQTTGIGDPITGVLLGGVVGGVLFFVVVLVVVVSSVVIIGLCCSKRGSKDSSGSCILHKKASSSDSKSSVVVLNDSLSSTASLCVFSAPGNSCVSCDCGSGNHQHQHQQQQQQQQHSHKHEHKHKYHCHSHSPKTSTSSADTSATTANTSISGTSNNTQQHSQCHRGSHSSGSSLEDCDCDKSNNSNSTGLRVVDNGHNSSGAGGGDSNLCCRQGSGDLCCRQGSGCSVCGGHAVGGGCGVTNCGGGQGCVFAGEGNTCGAGRCNRNSRCRCRGNACGSRGNSSQCCHCRRDCGPRKSVSFAVGTDDKGTDGPGQPELSATAEYIKRKRRRSGSSFDDSIVLCLEGSDLSSAAYMV